VARTVPNLEVALRRSNHRVVWALMSVVREGEDPSAGLEGYVVDISARKRADDLLRETEALRSVAALATAAAHEINNSLNVLKGNLQLLAPRVDGELAAAHLVPALDAAKAIEEIVRRMNAIMRLELAEPSATLPEMLDLRKCSAAPSASGADASITG
jgi:signal transduction histidine kinase